MITCPVAERKMFFHTLPELIKSFDQLEPFQINQVSFIEYILIQIISKNVCSIRSWKVMHCHTILDGLALSYDSGWSCSVSYDSGWSCIVIRFWMVMHCHTILDDLALSYDSGRSCIVIRF